MSELTLFQANHAELFDELKHMNVNYVIVEYSGSGDSGQIDSVTGYEQQSFGKTLEFDELCSEDFRAQEGLDIDTVARPGEPEKIKKAVIDRLKNQTDKTFADQLDELCMDALTEVNATDWYNNEGGGGKMILDVRAGRAKFEHYYTRQQHDESYEI